MDTATDKRDEVLDLVRRTYGYDSVLPMSTYTTEGSASAVQTACRGLEIPTTEAMNISNSLTDDSLKDQYYGNPKKEIPVNTRFKNMVDKHDGLFDLILSYDGLIKGRSQHASGVVVFNNGYIEEGNSMMKTTKGVEVTAYNADDTEFMGGLKIDLLSTDALTRIQTTMDLLLEDGLIEWQGSLRETYNKYLHPDVLEMEAPEMYDLLYSGEVISAFQFSTDVGSQAIRKVNARDFDDLSAANSLMRLSVQGSEQPIDKYVRFRDSINLWYDEMASNGLTQDEIKLMEKHLKVRYGICDTQELLILLVMDVAGYDLTEANMFRKLVAKANTKALEKEYDRYIKKGLENNQRQEFLDYVWNYCFKHQFSYSFSAPHITGYTTVTVQEMNLAYKYTPLYWQTACLIVDSGGKENDGQKDYGKIARATNALHGRVTSPHINKSGLTFTPVRENNQIVFGLNPIRGLRIDTLETILEHRPYQSFDDFYERMVKNKIISEKQTIILIKAGVFNELENKSSWDILVDFVNKTIQPRNLNMTHFLKVYESGIIDTDTYKSQYILYKLRQYIRENKYVIKDRKMKEYIIDNFEFELDCDENGHLLVLEKPFEKHYDEQIDQVRKLLKNTQVTEDYLRLEKRQYWKDECLGTVESWEMETIGFYSDKHELELLPLPNKKGFLDIPDGQKGLLAGVVIDKDKNKNIFYLSTLNGVATVKTYANIYNQLDEVIDNGKKGKDRVIYDESWFDRGVKLLVEGNRDGNNMFTTSISRIYGYNEDNIAVTTTKNKGEM